MWPRDFLCSEGMLGPSPSQDPGTWAGLNSVSPLPKPWSRARTHLSLSGVHSACGTSPSCLCGKRNETPALRDGLSGLPQSPGRLSSGCTLPVSVSTYGIFLWKEHFIRGTALSRSLLVESQQGGQMQCDLGQGWGRDRGHALKTTAEIKGPRKQSEPLHQCLWDQLPRPEVPHGLVLILSWPQRRKRSCSWSAPLGAPFPLLMCPPSHCPQPQALRASAFKGKWREDLRAPWILAVPTSLFRCCSLPTSLSRDVLAAACTWVCPRLSQAEEPLLTALQVHRPFAAA